MTFLAPLALGIGAAAAALLFGLHLITRRRPPPAPLPTARFVPVSDARAVARASRPTDLVLLALRMLVVLLIGAAFARPVMDAAGPGVRSVVLLDVSAAVADPAVARAAARDRLTAGGALVLFDTAAREVPVGALDGLDTAAAAAPAALTARPTPADWSGASRAALSPALLAGGRAAARIARGADSVRLVLVSPVGGDAIDAATRGIRDAWPGGIALVRVPAVADTAVAPPVDLVSTLADDPLTPAFALLPRRRGAHEVRITREAPTPADSAWARMTGRAAERGSRRARVLIHWPLATAPAPAADAVLATGPRAATLVAPLARRTLAGDGRVLARWRDGTPAALERPLGDGCVRDVGVGLPLAGDITLRAPFTQLLGRLVEPCGGPHAAPAADSSLGWLVRGSEAAPARTLASGTPQESALGAWLLVAALALLLVEWSVRRTGHA